MMLNTGCNNFRLIFLFRWKSIEILLAWDNNITCVLYRVKEWERFHCANICSLLLVLEIDVRIVCWLRQEESCIAWNKHDLINQSSLTPLLNSPFSWRIWLVHTHIHPTVNVDSWYTGWPCHHLSIFWSYQFQMNLYFEAIDLFCG